MAAIDQDQALDPTPLRVLLATRRVLQTDVASQLDLSEPQLSQLLNGRRPLDARTYSAIERAIIRLPARTLRP